MEHCVNDSEERMNHFQVGPAELMAQLKSSDLGVKACRGAVIDDLGVAK
jgi:hypothetical protein